MSVNEALATIILIMRKSNRYIIANDPNAYVKVKQVLEKIEHEAV